MFVQRVADSCKLNSEPMHYGINSTVEQLKCAVSSYQDLEGMSQKVSKQQEALDEMKKQVEIASTELAASRCALSDVYESASENNKAAGHCT